MFLSSRLRAFETSCGYLFKDGIGLSSFLITVVSVPTQATAPPSGLKYFTLSMEISQASVPKNHPLQNQSRSSPEASSMVRKKSAGSGCLKAQRRAYSLNE